MSLEMRYFILKPAGDSDHAIASRRAMQAYAKWLSIRGIETDNREMQNLARDVNNWAFEEHAESQKRRNIDGTDQGKMEENLI